MAVHNSEKYGNLVASGQIGENPTIHVWNAQTRKTLSVLSGRHKRGSIRRRCLLTSLHPRFLLGVCSLSFSGSGKLILSVGVDAPFTVAVWRWEEGLPFLPLSRNGQAFGLLFFTSF